MVNGQDQRARWDLKYEQGQPSLTKPDPFFLLAYEKFIKPSFPNGGVALDLAGGLGRHALWLASRRWKVSVVDVSQVALGMLRETADAQSIGLNLIPQDAAEYKFESLRFDLIVLFYHLDRRLFPRIVSALRPGGVFVCKMAVQWVSAMSLNEADDRPLDKGELSLLVPSLDVIACDERPVRDRGVVEFVGKLPL